MPGEPKRYDLSAIAVWLQQDLRRQYKRGRSDGESDDDQISRRRIRDAEVLDAEAGAQMRRMRADQMAGKLVSTSEVRSEVIEWCVRTRTPLMALADEITSIVPGEVQAHVKKKVTAAVRRVLKQAHDSAPLGMSFEEVVLAEAKRINEQRRKGTIR